MVLKHVGSDQKAENGNQDFREQGLWYVYLVTIITYRKYDM